LIDLFGICSSKKVSKAMNPIFRAQANLDSELQWIVKSTVETLFAQADGKTITRGQIFEAVAPIVGSVLVERLGDNRFSISVDEFLKLAQSIFANMGNDDKQGAEFFAETLASNLAMYAELRSQGMQSPFPKPERHAVYSDFDPFSQPGGFCNPIKLKLMVEDEGIHP
jgi:hypothetical protein